MTTTTNPLTLAEVAELVDRHGANVYISGGKSRVEFTDDQLMAFAAELVQRGREDAARAIENADTSGWPGGRGGDVDGCQGRAAAIARAGAR